MKSDVEGRLWLIVIPVACHAEGSPHAQSSCCDIADECRSLHQILLSFVRHNIEDLNRRHSVGFDLIQLEHEFPEFKKMILKISKFYKVGKFDRNNADIVPTLEYDGKGGQALIHLECVAADELLAGGVREPVMEVRAANTLVDNAEPEVTTPPPPSFGMVGKGETGLGGGLRVTLRRFRML